MPLARRSLFILALPFTLAAVPACYAQSQSPPNDQTGVAPYQAYGGQHENISLATGNLNLQIPLLTLPGRNGHNLTIALQYDSAIWQLTSNLQTGGFNDPPKYVWSAEDRFPNVDGSWRFNFPVLAMSVQPWSSGYCWTNFVVTLPDGSKHGFYNGVLAGCFTYSPQNGSVPDPALNITPGMSPFDTSYLTLDTSNASDAVIRLKDGTSIHFPTSYATLINGRKTIIASKIEDTDGNLISIAPNNQSVFPAVASVTDTLNRTINFTSNGLTYTDTNGNSQSILFSFKGYPSSTDLSLPSTPNTGGVGGAAPNGLSSVTLPNGLSYKFEYNSTDGELSKITYPTGGYTRYDYQTFTHWWEAPFFRNSGCDTCSWPGSVAASFREIVAKHECRDPVGACTASQEDTTSYTPTIDSTKVTNQSTDLVDALGNKTHYQFSCRTSSDQPLRYSSLFFPREVMRYIYQGQATLLRTVQTDYSPLMSDGRPGFASLPIRETITLSDSNQVSKVERDYDTTTFGAFLPLDNVLEKREFDWGVGTPGALLRRTDYTWLKVNPMNSVDYTAATINILNRKASETVYDSTSNQCLGQSRACAQTTYEYDSYTGGIAASGATQHDAAFNTNFATRGNVTAIHVWRNTDGATLEHRNLQFDDAGNVLQSRDPLLNVTKFSYADSWANATCAPSGGVAAAYKTTVTNALSQVATSKYNSCAGSVASVTDVNTQSINSTYDFMGRLTQSNLPDGGQITRTFNETATPLVYTTSAKISASLTLVPPVTVDGLGRVTQSQLTSDPEGTTYVDTTYDSLGRKQTVSNPYRTTSDPTYGITTYNYDVLGRVIQVIPPDGTSTSNNVNTTYSGNCATSTDQAGKIRKSCTDALGRLVQVFEPGSSNNLVNETDYTYDALNNLLSVQQKGNTTDSTQWRTRTFVYNSLSQLLSSTNPETGTITYTYDSDGNVLTRTDARNITTTLVYDALNRLTQKTFSDSTPQVTYWYDGQTPAGCSPTLTAANGIGRRTAMCDAAGWEAWSYDQMGRALVERRSTNSVVKTTNYSYNLDGSLASVTYPSGKTVTYAPSGAARPQSAVDSASNVNFALSGLYAPHGGLTSLTLGQATGFAGITYSESYSTRLQPLTAAAANPSAAIFSLTYNFGLGTADNGNINTITNNLNSNRTQTFTYDQLNRVKTALSQGASGSTCWGLDYSYDIWANLTTVALDPARPSCSWTILSAGITTNNRVNNTGFAYDAAGNVLSDGSFSYTWDGESQMKSAAGVNYTYDGDGRRVKKSSGKLYWYGATGEILAESDASGNITSEYVFFVGKRIARRDSSGNVFYYLSDHLDSSRVIAQSDGTVCYDADFDPFGGEHVFTNTCPQGYKFNGKERDAETGNDDFGARSYASTFGRFLSPDWSAIPAPVPYADLGNPQTLNQYAFVKDNPVAFSDPSGHLAEGQTGYSDGMYVVARMRGGGSATGCALDGSCRSSVIVGYELTSANGDVMYFATEGQALAYIAEAQAAQNQQTQASVSQPTCEAQMRSRPGDITTINGHGAYHAWWFVIDNKGDLYTLSFTAQLAWTDAGVNYILNAYVTKGGQSSSNANDNLQHGAVYFDTGRTAAACGGVTNMLAAAKNFPKNFIPYVPATSNSGAHYLANAGDFQVPRPHNSVGWDHIIKF